MACPQGHRSSLLVPRTQGGAFCLPCFTDLITAPSAFVTHRGSALVELLQALEDIVFCSTLMQHHRHFLVAPLAEAICFTNDEELVQSMVDIVLSLCKLAPADDDSLLQDFVLHISLQLSSKSPLWSKGHRFSVSQSTYACVVTINEGSRHRATQELIVYLDTKIIKVQSMSFCANSQL